MEPICIHKNQFIISKLNVKADTKKAMHTYPLKKNRNNSKQS